MFELGEKGKIFFFFKVNFTPKIDNAMTRPIESIKCFNLGWCEDSNDKVFGSTFAYSRYNPANLSLF